MARKQNQYNWRKLMKKSFLLFLFIVSASAYKSQKPNESFIAKQYIGFYGLGVSTSIDRNADYLERSEGRTFKEFSFEINTSQGFKFFNRFTVSAMVALDKHTGYHRLFLPIKGDVKYFFKTIDSEENNFFVYGNFGKNIGLSKNFANGFSSSFGIGILINGDFDEKIYVSLEIKNQQDRYNNKNYSFGNTGFNFGINF